MLLANNLHQHSLGPAAVKLAVENLLPRAEVQFAFGDRDDDFAAHDLTLEMGVSVIFSRAIVPVSAGRRVWRESFQPNFVIVMKSGFIVINKDRSGDVHGIDETKAFGDAALVNEFFDLRRDVDEPTSARDFEPKMFSE